jgi:hypothetical protein
MIKGIHRMPPNVRILANNSDLPSEFQRLKKPTRYGYIVPDPKKDIRNDLKSMASQVNVQFKGSQKTQRMLYHSIVLNSKDGRNDVIKFLGNPQQLMGQKEKRNKHVRTQSMVSAPKMNSPMVKKTREEINIEMEIQRNLHRNLSKNSNRQDGLLRLFSGLK